MSTPPKGQKLSPKIKPMVIIVDEPSNESESPPPSRAPSAAKAFTANNIAVVISSSESPPSSQAGSPSGSPTARGSDSQSRMRGLSKVSFRIKQLVSKEKRRFEENGFNLDLTYVTSRLIAFGYPAENLEGIYRNHYKDVYNFFEQRHPQRYRIYNLCTERSYDKGKFHNRVAEFRFDDHCPPPVAMFLPFCQDVDAWLHEHPENVAAIHCKAGKGRTGVMICAYLLYTGAWKTADGAMQFFAAARSLKSQGVTIPSQRRFIAYFGEMCRQARNFESNATSSDDEANGNSGLEDKFANDDRTMNDESDAFELERKLGAADFKRLWQDEMEGHGKTSRRQMFQCQPKQPTTTHLTLTNIKISGVYCQKKIEPRICIECGGTKQRRLVVYDDFGPFGRVGASSVGHSSAAPDASAQEVDKSSQDESEQPLESATPPLNARPTPRLACMDLELACDRCVVWDEVKVTLRNRNGTRIGQFWFHTAFVKRAVATGATPPLALVLEKHEIDKVVKDIKHQHKQFAPSFAITLAFERATEEDVAAATFAQTLKGLRVDTTSASTAFSTRFSSPGSVSPGKGGGGDKRTDGWLNVSDNPSPALSTAENGERPRAKSGRGAQRQEALRPVVAAKSTRVVGDIEVFSAAAAEDSGDSAESAVVARPAERSSPSPSPLSSPKSQLSRFFSSRASRRKTTEGRG